MVAKLISGKSIRGVLSYNEQKGKEDQAKLICISNFARTTDLSFKAKLDRFKFLIKKNPRAKTNAIHISLNFDPSEKPDQTTLGQIATDYMEEIGFGNQPYLVYQHFDAAHPHVHIVTTNIQENGKELTSITSVKPNPRKPGKKLKLLMAWFKQRANHKINCMQ